MTNRFDSPYIYMVAPELRQKLRLRIAVIKTCASVFGAVAIIFTILIAISDGLKIELSFLDTPVFKVSDEDTYTPSNSDVSLSGYRLKQMYTIPSPDILRSEISNSETLTQNQENISQNNTIPEIDTDVNAELPSDSINQEQPDLPDNSEETVPDNVGGGNILITDLSGSPAEGEILIRNETPYQPDINALKNRFDTTVIAGMTSNIKHSVTLEYDAENDATTYISEGSRDPVVLIVHTHGTECYNTDGDDSYTEEEARFRTHDTTQNLVAVGEVASQTLAEGGVTTLHCRVMHDAESYNNSYYYEAATIRKFLEMYPTIRFVIDMHRDAVLYSDNVMARPITETEQGDAAQLMFVVGSDYLGANHPNWQDNLALAILLQSGLNSSYPSIMRPICLRGASYNEHYTSGSLLLEVGSCGNSLDEAKLAAKLFSEKLALYIASGLV